MAELSENLIKFGWLTKTQMTTAISSGSLAAYNICFCKDEKTIYILDKDLNPVQMKSRVPIYGSVELANEGINNESSTYEGEIVSIRNGEYFDAYIVCKEDDTYFVKPVYEESDLDYDLLINTPIKNIQSGSTNRIVLSTLEDGIYKINYFTTPAGEQINSVVGNIIIVDGESITRVNGKKIVKYESGLVQTYVTDKYVTDQGYVTETELDTKIANLKIALENYIVDYVTNTVTLLVKHLVDEELDSRYSTDSDIQELFD